MSDPSFLCVASRRDARSPSFTSREPRRREFSSGAHPPGDLCRTEYGRNLRKGFLRNQRTSFFPLGNVISFPRAREMGMTREGHTG